MSPSRFTHYLLRTTDVDAASAFYQDVLERRGDGIVALHDSSLARGARPHWLGHLAVGELGGVEAVAARFVELGAIRIGPPQGAGEFVVLRDPGGAMIALTDSSIESSAGVVWHQLNTRDPSMAAANYSSLLGWSFSEKVDLGHLGTHQRFAFAKSESSIGVISGVEDRPNVHPHWLFFFTVSSLDIALQRVRTLGGTAMGPIELPNGVRVAVCDDVQGATFGIIENDDAAKLVRAR